MIFTARDKAYPFRFKLKRPDGGKFSLLYDNHTSQLVHEETGERLIPENDETRDRIWERVPRVSPETPGMKVNDTRTLKIQLGLGCNYSCSYCLQSTQLGDAVKTSTRDAEIFLDNIERHNWFGNDVQRIEFWGGEPMLYWHKVRVLLPALKARWPKARMSTITNGSMFSEMIIQDMIDYEMSCGISHDGPGQWQRGPDPLDDPLTAGWLHRAVDAFAPSGRVGFSSVLTSQNYDAAAIIDWFEERFPHASSNFEGIGYDYHGDAATRWTPEKLRDMREKIAVGIMNGSLLRSPSFVGDVQRIFTAIADGRPSEALGQRCGMDREENIAVDLLGNVTTCQNTASKGKHRLGHMRSLDKVELNTSWHWEKREECASCPVLQQCAGGCMYLDNENWAVSCDTEFHYRTGILAGALYHLTGGILTGMDGDMIRPEPPVHEQAFPAGGGASVIAGLV